MIDTIHIELPNSKAPNLEIEQTTVDAKTGEIKYGIGYIAGIKVKQSNHVIRIECSLPKLIKGSNIHMLSYPEVLEALEKIEQVLEVSLQEGIIRRIDCFINIPTNHTPSSYFRYLGDVRYLTRMPVDKTSLYYKNNVRELYFYDKIAEMNKNRNNEYIPDSVGHLLRIEYRLKNTAIKSLFGRPIHVVDLHNKNLANKLIEALFVVYSSIFKDTKPYFDITSVGSGKIFTKQLAYKGIESYGGSNSVIEMIEHARQKHPGLPPEYISRRKKEVRDIAKMNDSIMDCESIIELNAKVKEMCDTLIN